MANGDPGHYAPEGSMQAFIDANAPNPYMFADRADSAGNSVQLVASAAWNWELVTGVSGGNWITMPAITTDSTKITFYQDGEEEELADIDELISSISGKLDKLEDRVTKMECRIGDGLGRIEQTLEQIVRKVYGLH